MALTTGNFLLTLFLCLLAFPVYGAVPVPPPKNLDLKSAKLSLHSVSLTVAEEFENEAETLKELLREAHIQIAENGRTPVTLDKGQPEVPEFQSDYREEILRQSYAIEIGKAGVLLRAPSPQAMFHAIQTFDQLREGQVVPFGSVTDWPDIPLRMIMVDPARQNENLDYYRRVIDFAARYKINAILCHLTDDQTSALYHEDYPPLMHEHAWKPEEIRDLITYAGERHIELIPEIESLGHSRMFTRLDDYQDYLHQTNEDQADRSWMGTDIPGYTNVLCPASDKAVDYLDSIYRRASNTFDHPWIHVGFDEVDMTECKRCIDKFGKQTESEWMAAALQQASRLAAEHGRKTALWGDMLLSHPAVVEDLSREDTIIFDWHYGETVDPQSVHFFKERGFQVVATPALACAPHMNLPDRHNFQNIENFARIARENDLLGINTTVWVPTRYLSDAMWTGIGYAAAQSWGGSNFDQQRFFHGFTRDFFGSDQGAAYQEVWKTQTETIWHRSRFNTACWIDQESLAKAKEIVRNEGAQLQETRDEVYEALRGIDRITPTITKHREEWQRVEDATEVLLYSINHLLAAPMISGENSQATVKSLDARLENRLAEIERDWDRNRFADDPGKEGRFLRIQHLLYQFKQMREFHQELLEEESGPSAP